MCVYILCSTQCMYVYIKLHSRVTQKAMISISNRKTPYLINYRTVYQLKIFHKIFENILCNQLN